MYTLGSHSQDASGDAQVRALIAQGQILLAQGQTEAAKAQFDAAADALYREYQHYLFVLCLSYLYDPEQAEEMCHEVLSTAYLAMPTFRQESSVKTWLSGICHKKIHRAHRDWSRRKLLLKVQQGVIQAEVHAHGSPNAVQELLEMLREYGVYTLSQRDRTLFIKRYIEGYTLAELTTRWTSETAVRKRLAKIIQHLQRYRKDAWQ
jgi:RNA polymerase sigma-70 factor, ECF subfamily